MGTVVAIVVVAGTAGALALLGGDDDSGSTASATTTSTVFDDTTTTTSTAAAVTSTTAAAASTTSTTAKATTTTVARVTTTTGVVATCGSGKATVSFTAKDLVTDALSSTFTPQVTVDNQVTQPIEVDEVVIEITFPNAEVRSVRFTTAGTVIGPGTSASFTADKVVSAQRYSSVKFTRFAYFTAGKKADCRAVTP